MNGLVFAIWMSTCHMYDNPRLIRLDQERQKLRPFLNAIAFVESNNNDKVVGDHGKAIGRYQIWESYWHDAVQSIPAIGGHYQDVRRADYAERILVAYLDRYASQAIMDGNYEVLARIHNGGPKGYQKKATKPYWDRVRKALKHETG